MLFAVYYLVLWLIKTTWKQNRNAVVCLQLPLAVVEPKEADSCLLPPKNISADEPQDGDDENDDG